MADPLLKDMLGRQALIAVYDAQRILQDRVADIRTEIESVEIEQSFGRTLAEKVQATEDLPLYPRSTMDGFAVKAADTFGASDSMPCYLEISGEVLMGQAPDFTLSSGTCAKIPTGGLLPTGADSVVMLEHTVDVDGSMIEVVKGVGEGTNLISRGEDISAGTTALEEGHTLRPQDVGLLAGLGVTAVKVYRKVRVGIVSTGDEIIPHGQKPAPGQIRNINSLAIAGQVLEVGGEWVDYGIVSDREEIFLPVMKRATEECDIVLFSGGSSVGVRDLGEEIIGKLGSPGLLVHGVKLKPGKPILIGLAGTTPVFGLPGHPVSAMVCFDYFVKPTMKSLAGSGSQQQPRAVVTARLTRNINSAAGRRDVIRVRLAEEGNEWLASPVMGKSGSITTLSRAHGYFEIDEDSQGISENAVVEVQLYS